eukprot:10281042-Prorocentrum_lima.AAC.1
MIVYETPVVPPVVRTHPAKSASAYIVRERESTLPPTQESLSITPVGFASRAAAQGDGGE